jgi:hypothetical protein
VVAAIDGAGGMIAMPFTTRVCLARALGPKTTGVLDLTRDPGEIEHAQLRSRGRCGL